ncbi:MAG TPA: nitroreductase family protein [Acidobacteriaceae bacterium]|jgi:nitroreductase|nr:nitroreductase family protein [Acidobacteriaceae bacterium]
MEKTLSEAIEQRRSTPSFDGRPIPDEDLQRILAAGLSSPSGFNLQPWRLIVVRAPEQLRRLRAAAFNQANVEEASVVIAACGDKDGWRTDTEEMIRMGLESGMTENYAESARVSIREYLGDHPNLAAWLNRQVMVAVTTMMWTAEVMGYDTALTEGFEPEKICEVLKLPLSYIPVTLVGIGYLKGPDKFDGGRFSMQRLVFEGEYGKPLKL